MILLSDRSNCNVILILRNKIKELTEKLVLLEQKIYLGHENIYIKKIKCKKKT